tara:strand:- start:98 stop:712 length:615 start_codon:yes stop_codon:yes gene_type:complete
MLASHMGKDEEEAREDSNPVEDALRRLRGGDKSAWKELLPLIYSELHSLARREMASQSPTHTLQPTALVNEAFLKLCNGRGVASAMQADFLGLAATAMRSILTDHARAKNTNKRTIPGATFPISEALDIAMDNQWNKSPITVLELNDLLDRYEKLDAVGAKLVELRFFAGRTVEESAAALGIAPRTAHRMWDTARAWLKRELNK